MMTTRLMYVAVAMALLACCVDGSNCSGGGVEEKSSSSRQLREIITTPACRNIRAANSYPARLDMIYLYSVQYEGSLDTLGIEKAIAASVASILNDCDDQSNEPLYVIQLSDDSQHRVISTDQSETCVDMTNNDTANPNCSLVRGITSILLEGGAAGLDTLIYPLIDATLKDSFFLSQYTDTNPTAALFQRSVASNLVLLDSADESEDSPDPIVDSSDDRTTNVAVIAAIVSVSVTACFLIAIYRNKHGDGTHQNVKHRVAHMQSRRRKYFHHLEDIPSLDPGWMVTNAVMPEQPTLTWSVSDLTSDAESIISSLPMDRIDEADETYDSAEEGDIETAPTGETETLPTPAMSPMNVFVAHWNDHRGGPDVPLYDKEKLVVRSFAFDYDDMEKGERTPFSLDGGEWVIPSARSSLDVNVDFDVAADPLHGCQFVNDGESGCSGESEISKSLQLSDDDDESEGSDATGPRSNLSIGVLDDEREDSQSSTDTGPPRSKLESNGDIQLSTEVTGPKLDLECSKSLELSDDDDDQNVESTTGRKLSNQDEILQLDEATGEITGPKSNLDDEESNESLELSHDDDESVEKATLWNVKSGNEQVNTSLEPSEAKAAKNTTPTLQLNNCNDGTVVLKDGNVLESTPKSNVEISEEDLAEFQTPSSSNTASHSTANTISPDMMPNPAAPAAAALPLDHKVISWAIGTMQRLQRNVQFLTYEEP